MTAWNAGRDDTVNAWQWRLTSAVSGTALAVTRGTETHGKHRPGGDGAPWSTPAATADALSSLSRRGEQAQPRRRVPLPKAKGKTRPLGLAT